MRILMLTQWFDPEPTFKGLTFAKALRERGHEVEILTGFPNYPGGKVYPGYRIRPFQREVMEGIPVIRVPLYPSHDNSAIRRVANYATFALSAAAIGTAAVKPADVMYVYHPPATVAFPAMLIGSIRRIPFVYDIQDLWPDTLGATGMVNNKSLLKMVGRWCRWTYRAAARIVVLSPGFKELLVARGVPREKIEVIYN
jgi:glycosyltransferase involved in cell wall biosynthesis